MAYARVIVGGFIFLIGVLTLVRTMFENMPTLNDTPLQVLDFSKMPAVAVTITVEAAIIVIGMTVLASSKRSSQSPANNQDKSDF